MGVFIYVKKLLNIKSLLTSILSSIGGEEDFI